MWERKMDMFDKSFVDKLMDGILCVNGCQLGLIR
jgi:hypothetical protein